MFEADNSMDCFTEKAQYRVFIREHEEPIVSENDIEELTSVTGSIISAPV